MTSALRLVVFDVDGTLIDSQDFIVAAMTRAFDQIGRAVPARADILSIVGLSLPQAVAQLVPDMSDAEVHETADLYKAAFVALRSERGGEAHAPLYAGARAALERLGQQDELFLGVATGKAMRGLDHMLDTHDLRSFFHTLQTADHHPSKPHPSMLMQTLKDTGVEAVQAVMIGDTSYDIDMARAAGFHAIGVGWGYHPAAQLKQSGAQTVIDHFDDLDAALNDIWANT